MTDNLQNQSISQPSVTSRSPIVWKPHQQQLLGWFLEAAPSLAKPYEAAVMLMEDDAFPARIHLICHIVRDIYSELPTILDGDYIRVHGGSVYPGAIDKLGTAFKPYFTESLSPSESENSPDPSDRIEVSTLAVHQVQELVQRHEKIKAQPTSATVLVEALYRQYAEVGSKPNERLIRAFAKARKWFTGRAHLVRDPNKSPTDNGLQEHFEAFERTLHSLVAPHFTIQGELDDILQQANR